MFSFFFGSSDGKLHGVLESSAQGSAGALICGSWGPEGQSAHRFLRQLGKRLAAAGWSTMRFDYFGSGDSYGEQRDLTLATMIANTRDALEELRAAGGVDAPVLIGYRLGALPALAVAREEGCGVVLVDPVLDGGKWLQAIESGPWAGPLADGCFESGGFVMGRGLRDELQNGAAKIDPAGVPELATIVVSRPETGAGLPAEKVVVVPSEPAWRLDNGLAAAAVSPDFINAVVERVTRLGSARI